MDERELRRLEILHYYQKIQKKSRLTQTGEMKIITRRIEKEYREAHAGPSENPCSRIIVDPGSRSIHYLDDPAACCFGTHEIHRRSED
jgi:hypothetical protein